MLTHRGFSAWITCEGEPIPELEPTLDAATNRMTCWIPSQEGKHFAVHWKDHGSNVDTCGYITLDGFVVSGRFLFGQGETSRAGVRTSSITERPFMFAKVDTSENGKEPEVKDLGMVILKIKRVKRVVGKAANPIQQLPDIKRGLWDHKVGYGTEKIAYLQYPQTWSVEPYDEKNPGTFVSFVFRYRPRGFLLTQGISFAITSPSFATTVPTVTPPKSKSAVQRRVPSGSGLGSGSRRQASSSSRTATPTPQRVPSGPHTSSTPATAVPYISPYQSIGYAPAVFMLPTTATPSGSRTVSSSSMVVNNPAGTPMNGR